MVETRFDCPPDLKDQFVAMCDARGEAPGAVLRLLMLREIDSWKDFEPTDHGMSEEALFANLRKRVARVWRGSKTWDDLIDGLERDQLLLRPCGNGLIICALGTGRKLATASQVGPGYHQMVRRFGRGFPQSARPWTLHDASGTG